jgi:hypothetical protein
MIIIPEHPNYILTYFTASVRQLAEDSEFASWLVTPKEDGSTSPNDVRCKFM